MIGKEQDLMRLREKSGHIEVQKSED